MTPLRQLSLALILLGPGAAHAEDALASLAGTPLFVVVPASTLPEVVKNTERATITKGTAVCAELRVRKNGDSLALEFVDDSSGSTFHASLFHGVDGGPSKLKGWFVESTAHTSAPAACEQAFSTRPWSVASSEPTAAYETSAGPVFREEAACRRHAGAAYETTCVSGVCMSTELSAPVFSLGDCALEVRAATRRVREIDAVAADVRQATLNKTLALWRSGGAFFEPVPGAACRRWAVKPVKGAKDIKADARATTILVDDTGTTTVEVSLWTARRVAVEHSRSRQQGLGSLGSTGGQQSLAFGNDRFYLDGQPRFFDAETCAAAR